MLARLGVIPLLALIGLPGTGHAQTPFYNEIVDAAGTVGSHCALTIDASGDLHVVYYDATSGNLKYAVRRGGVWATEVVGSASASTYPALAVDSQGNPHVIYNSTIGSTTASKSGGVWTFGQLSTWGSTGTSIAIDAGDVPHVTYQVRNSDLLYDGGAVVNPSNPGGAYSSLALDSRGSPVVSYQGTGFGGFLVATRTGGVWSSSVLSTHSAFHTSLAVDVDDYWHVAYHVPTNTALEYDSNKPGIYRESVADLGGVTDCSLRLDASGIPHVVYATGSGVTCAVRTGAVSWTSEDVTRGLNGASYASLALDEEGNQQIAFYDPVEGDLLLADASVSLASPSGGETWPVGGLRVVDWKGVGPVDILLSVDGGASYQTLRSGIQAQPFSIRVPHLPTRFATLQIRRTAPTFSTDASDSLFTIEASIALVSFQVTAPQGGAQGAMVAWSTVPGPEDLAGYRLERAFGPGASWQEVLPSTRETSFHDPEGTPGSRYRLTALNGLGEAYVLGESALGTTEPLAAWPLPFAGGDLTISFATLGGFGGGRGPVDLAVFDVTGRRVATVVRGDFLPGTQSATWDGRDSARRLVGPGVYFLRLSTTGNTRTTKIVVSR